MTALAIVWVHWHAPAPVAYVTRPVTRGAVTPFVTASGTLNPVVIVQVGTYVSGVIQELHCDFNTQVHKGQLCARIDPRPYQTAVDQDRANLQQARAQLEKDRTSQELAKVTFQRNQDLIALDSVSKEDFDTAQSNYRQATSQIALDQATVAQRAAALRSSEVNLGYTDITSPVDGTVVSRNITQGQTVAASFQTPTLFIIATDLTKMQVDTNVSESDIGEVAEGNESSFTVEAFPSRTFRGHIVQVRQAPQTVQNVVTYDAVVEVDNSELLLKPGMTATARIITHRHDDVLRVPDAALRYSPAAAPAQNPSPARGGAEHVWVLRNGHLAMVAIQAALDDGEYAEIAHGELHVGDQLVVSENAVRPGAKPIARPLGQGAPRAPRL
jgi:HlyD family secretion protein